MLSYIGDDDSDGYLPLGNSIMSWFSMEKIYVSLYYDEDEYTTTGSYCKKLLWVKKILKECIVRQDVLTFVSNIFTKPLDVVNF